ncbi:MAG: hypothetical protein ACTHOK_07295, partial [Nocardioidaceae bacterium]
TSALAQFNDARNAPGFAKPGGYTAATDHIQQGMGTTPGTWQEVTTAPYNSDDQRYHDFYSNATAGSGYVTGRTQALATEGHYLYAAGAVGGVERLDLDDEGQGWTAISQDIPALSSGALAARDGQLWYATGDGSTGATTYTGDGVWMTEHPTADPSDGGTPNDPSDDTPKWEHLNTGATVANGSLGGTTAGQGSRAHLFDGAVIQQLRFSPDDKWVYAPSSYGLWRHAASTSGSWEPVFVPHPEYLPTGDTSTGTHSTDNYVTDVAIDPTNPDHVVVALGWVAGGSENGWYDGHYNDKSDSWSFTKSNVKGAINPKDIGRTTFAWGPHKLYALVHNPDHASQGISYSELGGIYVSKSGSIDGPWAKIADSHKLANSGSALDPTVKHAGAVNPGYQPGVQAWYNQFLAVDPENDDHVYAGLEEVYETKNGGANWTTPGPYWNFFFDCWGKKPLPDHPDQVGCNPTTHSDQHAVAINDTTGQVFVGNDGGIYARPLNGQADKDGHATDWQSLSAPDTGTPDFLQYYAVGVGKVNADKVKQWVGDGSNASDDEIVSGGLQDNGGSILFTSGEKPEQSMGSNFGGDGGDVLVDPSDGCRIVQEYVDLSMRVTNVCAAAKGLDSFESSSRAHTRDIAPPESAARFTAPFAADHADINTWLAGGQHVWLNTDGFNIASGDDWKQLADLGAGNTATAVASDNKDAIVSYCGSCGAEGFAGGIAVGRAEEDAKWEVIPTDKAAVVNDGGHLPNRMIAGVDVFHKDGVTHYLIAFNGFSRRWVEGPGAGIGHVFESTDGTGTTWIDLSGDSTAKEGLPDVPANTVKALTDGSIVVGTDLGAFIRSPGENGTWTKLGDNLPLTVVNDLEPGPEGDNSLYAATYGRGIWKLPLDSVPHYAGGDAEGAGDQDSYWQEHQPKPTS